MAEMETKAPQAGTGNQHVTLGVGTLIIIALIVTMCSGRSEVDRIQKDTAELKQKLEVIDQKLDMLVPEGSTATPTSGEAQSQNP